MAHAAKPISSHFNILPIPHWPNGRAIPVWFGDGVRQLENIRNNLLRETLCIGANENCAELFGI